MEDREQFNIEEYIKKRMMEIPRLEERALYKEIVGNLLKELYQYNEASFRGLEDRILSETKSQQSDYAIYLTLTDIRNYDATDSFMYPMAEEDTRQRRVRYEDVRQALDHKEECYLYTVFLQADASTLYHILHEDREFYGMIKTDNREYRGTFRVRRNEKYCDMIKDLYYIFAINYQPWITVCEAYLMKMLDVYLCTAEEMKDKVTIQEIRVDFEEYANLVRYDMVPLWNLKPLNEKTSTYPDPCVDQTNYEHQIYSHRLEPGVEYLIRNTDVEVTNIRRQKGDLIITCPDDEPREWQLYQVNKDCGTGRYPYPVLSNQYKESFSGSITELFRRSIKTKAEMARLIESFPCGDYVTFKGIEMPEQAPEGWEASNYSMDGFIQDEIRIGNLRQVLLIRFAAVRPGHYLNEDIMSFLVTQVQKLFPEYLCIGSLCR